MQDYEQQLGRIRYRDTLAYAERANERERRIAGALRGTIAFAIAAFWGGAMHGTLSVLAWGLAGFLALAVLVIAVQLAVGCERLRSGVLMVVATAVFLCTALWGAVVLAQHMGQS